MRHLKLTAIVAIPVLTVALGAVPAGSAAPTPGPPTAVHAISTAGIRGVTVSWSAPDTDGGSAIKYYVASTYTGDHSCTSFHPGPGTCHIAGLKVGAVKPSIRVRAISANGRGAVAVARITHGQPGTVTAAATPGTTGLSATSQTAATASTPSHPAGTATSASGLSTLPFSGTDVEALLVLGLILVAGGLLLLSPIGRRRPIRGLTADGLLRP